MKLILSVTFLLITALVLPACNIAQGQPVTKTALTSTVEKKDGLVVTTINTTTQRQLILIEPDSSGGRTFEPTIIYKPVITTESDCYNCYRKYYACIFGNGKNCISIGKSCDGICKARKGVLYTASTFANSVNKMQTQ